MKNSQAQGNVGKLERFHTSLHPFVGRDYSRPSILLRMDCWKGGPSSAIIRAGLMKVGLTPYPGEAISSVNKVNPK